MLLRHVERIGLSIVLPVASFCSASLSPPSLISYYNTYVSLLKSFVSGKALDQGKLLHARLLVSGLGFDTILATKLVDLYSKTGKLENAHYLFDKIPKQNVFLWNILIRAYAWNGPYDTAIRLYFRMLEHGLRPNNFTFPVVLKACAALSAIDAGREVHKVVSHSQWGYDVFVAAGLIDMYAKCGFVGDALEVFERITDRDAVFWNSMISAYAQNSLPLDALSLCGEMAAAGFRPTVVTLVSVISASANAAALPKGREIHGMSWRHGFHCQDKVKTALVDMYAKSGCVEVARALFERLSERRLVSWNAMISGYARHGHASEALYLFEELRRLAEPTPDHITFAGVLSACKHGSLIEEGQRLFDSMSENYSIQPSVQHYTCMVDLLGHSGRLDEALGLIREMPMDPDSGIWGTLLNACKIHRDVEMGELAFGKLVDLEPDDSGNYVIMSNVYAQVGKWDGPSEVRKMMTDRGLKKSIACSWIDVGGRAHAFVTGDRSHSMSEEIYEEMERLEGLMAEA